MIAHGQWLLKSGDETKGREGGLVDISFQKFAWSMLAVVGPNADRALASELVARADENRWSHQQMFEKAAGTGYYFPIIYAPHALGLHISRQFDLTMRSSYTLTRAIVLLTSVVLMGWALSLHTPNTLTLMVLMTPMSLFQISSPTIDGLCSAMAMTVIGLWFHLSGAVQRFENDHISWRELCLYGLIFILCTSRANLLPLLLLPLLLLKSRFHTRRLCAVGALYALTLGWLAFSVLTTYDNRVVRNYSTLEILARYLQHPGEFLELFIRTVSNEEIRRFYRDSFFGVLGWLDTPIPRQAVRVLAVFVSLAALVITFATRWREAISTRLSFLLIGVLSTGLIFFAMAISWTNYPAEIISGIQGRYFLIPCLFMTAALGDIQSGVRKLNRAELLIATIFLSYSLYLLLSTLSARYGLVNMHW